MAAPYQCLVAKSAKDAGDWILFGASGPKIVIGSSSGVTSTWPEQEAQTEVSVEISFRMIFFFIHSCRSG